MPGCFSAGRLQQPHGFVHITQQQLHGRQIHAGIDIELCRIKRFQTETCSWRITQLGMRQRPQHLSARVQQRGCTTRVEQGIELTLLHQAAQQGKGLHRETTKTAADSCNGRLG